MDAPKRYITKPLPVMAWQWDGTKECALRIAEWANGPIGWSDQDPERLRLDMAGIPAYAFNGDWIVLTEIGHFHACQEGAFNHLYTEAATQ